MLEFAIACYTLFFLADLYILIITDSKHDKYKFGILAAFWLMLVLAGVAEYLHV